MLFLAMAVPAATAGGMTKYATMNACQDEISLVLPDEMTVETFAVSCTNRTLLREKDSGLSKLMVTRVFTGTGETTGAGLKARMHGIVTNASSNENIVYRFSAKLTFPDGTVSMLHQRFVIVDGVSHAAFIRWN
jgi:hypothetical protein